MRWGAIDGAAVAAVLLAGCGLVYEPPKGNGPGAADAGPGEVPDGGSQPCDSFIQNADFSGPLTGWSDNDVILTWDEANELMIVEVEDVADATPRAAYEIVVPEAFVGGATYEIGARVGCEGTAPTGAIDLELRLRSAAGSDDAEARILFDCSRPTVVSRTYTFSESPIAEGASVERVEFGIDWTNIDGAEAVWDDRVLVDDVCYRRVE